jgi:hypothetical protein
VYIAAKVHPIPISRYPLSEKITIFLSILALIISLTSVYMTTMNLRTMQQRLANDRDAICQKPNTACGD